jgi:hypothetical protein
MSLSLSRRTVILTLLITLLAALVAAVIDARTGGHALRPLLMHYHGRPHLAVMH